MLIRRVPPCILAAVLAVGLAGCSQVTSPSTTAQVQVIASNGVPISGATSVSFIASGSAIGPTSVVSWLFSDDNSKATGLSVTHTFGPAGPASLSAPPCTLLDQSVGVPVAYTATATFTSTSTPVADITSPSVSVRTLTGTWIDDARHTTMTIASVGKWMCGSTMTGGVQRDVRAGVIDGSTRVVQWDVGSSTPGDCSEHHIAVVDPAAARLTGDVTTANPGASACPGPAHVAWTRCDAGVSCTATN